MSVYMGQWNVAGSGAVTACTMQIPPGVYNMAIYNTSATVTFYMGVGTSPTVAPAQLNTSTGLVMHSVPTYWNGYQGAQAGYLWVVCSAAPASFNYILSVQQR